MENYALHLKRYYFKFPELPVNVRSNEIAASVSFMFLFIALQVWNSIIWNSGNSYASTDFVSASAEIVFSRP